MKRDIIFVVVVFALAASPVEGEFLVDTSRVSIPSPYRSDHQAIAFDGTGFLVVWEDDRSGDGDIYGCRVTVDGLLLDPFGIAICRTPSYQAEPSVCFDGTNFVVVWEDARGGDLDVYGCRLTPDGNVLDPQGIPICTAVENQFYPAICCGGTNLLVVWEDWRIDNYADVCGARLSPQGVVLDPRGIIISSSTSHSERPDVAFGGGSYLVVWEDYRNEVTNVYGCRVTPGGTVLDPQGIPISTADWQYAPVLAFGGGDFLVAWENRNHAWDIFGSRVTPDGVVLDPQGIPISTAEFEQLATDLDFDGTNFLVVWQDMRSAYKIYGARVTLGGSVLEPQGIPISKLEDQVCRPVVASGGTNALVAWTTGRIYGARVSPEGAVLDTSDSPISMASNEQGTPAVASVGANFLAVWVEQRNYYRSIFGSRVTAEGIVLDPRAIGVSRAEGSEYYPSVSSTGSNYLVVWTGHDNISQSNILAGRVSPEGMLLDSEDIEVSTAVRDQFFPAACFDGANSLVVWTDYRSGDWPDIYGSRVSDQGMALDPEGIAICTAWWHQSGAAVASDGVISLAVWEDGRNASGDIYAARVSQQGIVLDPTSIAVSTAAGYQTAPSIASDGTDFLVVWEDRRSGDSADVYGCRVTATGAALDPQGIAICTAAGVQQAPVVSFDGAEFLVVWEDGRQGGRDLYGARVRADGTVHDEGPVVRQEEDQTEPAIACAAGGQILLVYTSWAGVEAGKAYNVMRSGLR